MAGAGVYLPQVLPSLPIPALSHRETQFDSGEAEMHTSRMSASSDGQLRFVMYHYVREFNGGLPYLKFLDFYDFKRQLDEFEKEYFFPSSEQLAAFLEGASDVLPRDRQSIVLTFDDGLIDHYNYVFPELRRRGLWGIFYISTGPLESKTLLDVHKVHVLLGRFPSEAVLQLTANFMKNVPECIPDELVAEFRTSTYTAEMQSNDQATAAFKRLINFFLKPARKEEILQQLMVHFFPNGLHELAQAWYMNRKQLGIMSSCGMILGAHSVSHPVLGSLSRSKQLIEIKESLKTVSEIVESNQAPNGTSSFRSFCFPYGGRHTYNEDTLQILREEACLFTLDVDPQDCNEAVLETRRQNLPRWDCNKFAFGQCFPRVSGNSGEFPRDSTEMLLTSLHEPKFRYRSITLFTGQHPRHVSLLRRLSSITDVLYVVQEVDGSLIPGQQASPASAQYFRRVQASELKMFKDTSFSPSNARIYCMSHGDASRIALPNYGDALKAEVFVVFGASFLKGELGNFLQEKGAINCHIGLSPYYRGSATTFWAVRDGNYKHNGATIHHLTSSLDGGDIICHAVPILSDDVVDAFDFTMKTVKVAHDALLHLLESGNLWRCSWTKQDSSSCLRYCKKSDFNEEIAEDWLNICPSRDELETGLRESEDLSGLVRPFYG